MEEKLCNIFNFLLLSLSDLFYLFCHVYLWLRTADVGLWCCFNVLWWQFKPWSYKSCHPRFTRLCEQMNNSLLCHWFYLLYWLRFKLIGGMLSYGLFKRRKWAKYNVPSRGITFVNIFFLHVILGKMLRRLLVLRAETIESVQVKSPMRVIVSLGKMDLRFRWASWH